MKLHWLKMFMLIACNIEIYIAQITVTVTQETSEQSSEVTKVTVSEIAAVTTSKTEVPSATASSQSVESSTPLIPVPTAKTADVCDATFVIKLLQDGSEKKCTCFNVEADCSHLDIEPLPTLLAFHRDVQIANFAGNRIANLKNDTFLNGRHLLELDMSYNEIDFVSSTTFRSFKSLRNLDLSHNRIWSLPIHVFQDLRNLRKLDLSFNDLIQVFSDLFASLLELRELYLESNPLKELEPKHFEHLAKLEVLNLESTMLHVIPDHLFIFTPRLRHLDLSGNQLIDVPSVALQSLNRVKVLDLSANPIVVVGQESFKGMTGLNVLYLDRMQHLAHIEKYAFGDAVNLRELHCSYNYMLADIDENAFVRKLNNEKITLDQLFLRQNDIRTMPKSLQDWNTGMELHLRDNPFHCDCRASWLVNMRLKNDFQSDVRCSSPSDLQNMALSDLKDKDLLCGMSLSEIMLIACAVVSGLLILVLIVAFLVWRRSYAGYTKPYFPVYKNKYADDTDYRGGDDDI